MLRLSMDDRCDALGGILTDAFPDAHHIATGGVHNLTADFLHKGNERGLGAKCGNDHDILGLQDGEVIWLGARRQAVDAQGRNLGVDIRVVDDFTEEINISIGKNLARRVSEVDRPFHAVAKTKFFCESKGGCAEAKAATLRADAFDQFAVVVFFYLCLDVGHHIRRPDINPRSGAQGCQFCSRRYWVASFLKTAEEIVKESAGSGSL